MKKLFKKTLSALLAVLCLGGMFAAAADAPAVEEPLQPNDAAAADMGDVILPAAGDVVYEDTGDIILPAAGDAVYEDTGDIILPADDQVQPREAGKEYNVTIPAGGKATLPQWNPYITKGTVIEVRALDTTPNGATFTFSLQCSNGGGFTYSISEEQTRRMTAMNSGDYSITFTATKAVTAKIKIVTDPN